jgi:protocatechuate 3,4-dioxygenase beta subunit
MVPLVPLRTLQRTLIVFAALVCVLFTATLFDTPAFRVELQTVVAPPLPDSVGERDGTLIVEVKDPDGNPIKGARVTILLIRDQLAYMAGLKETDEAGRVEAKGLPRGELWVLANSDGRGRASTRLVLGGEPKTVALVSRPAGKLAVRVTGDDEKPIVKATVEVRCGDPLPFIARTDADGKVALDRLCPPPYDVKVSADGYDVVKKSSVQPGALPLRITLKKLGSIAVAVVLGNGEPAPLATVYLAGSGVWPARKTQTNALGKALIGGLPAGSYDLRATRADLVSSILNGLEVKRGAQIEAKLTLEQGRKLLVQVVDGEGPDALAVKNANVVAVEGGLSSFPHEGRTDADGNVALGPFAGAVSVSARAEGFVPTTAVSVPVGAPTAVKIVLIKGGTLLGDVVDSRGFPVPGASIEVVGTDLQGLPIDESPSLQAFRAAHFSWALPGPRPLIAAGELGVMPGPIPAIPHGESAVPHALLRAGGDAPPPAAWITNREGLFSVGPIPPGRVRAIVRHPGYVDGISEMVSLSAGGQAKVHVVLQTGGSLEGRVTDERGFPVPGARVQITSQNGNSERSTLTADDGTFAFAAVARDLIVSVSRPSSPEEFAFQSRIVVTNDERKKLEIVLRAERDPIDLRVTDDRGYPIDAVQITAISLSKDSVLRSTVFTTKDGKANLPDAVGIAIRFEVSAPGYATLVKIVDHTTKDLVFQLVQGLRAHGKVTRRGGRERVEDASVVVYLETGARHLRTNKDGEYTVSDVSPGSLKIRVENKDHVAVDKVFTLVEPSTRDRLVELDPIDLQDSGTVEGEVVDERGDRVTGARVAKDAVPTWLPVGPLPPGVVATNSKGEFILGGLPEGNVTLEAMLPDLGKGKVLGVQVIAGRTTRRIRITMHKCEDCRSTDAAAGLLISLRDGAAGSQGVVVKAVSSGSTAERSGLTPGDVIVRIDGVVPSSAGDAQRRLAGPEHQDVLLEVQRGKSSHTMRAQREKLRQ